eukprot:14671743-Alexandrium_andersonii.AAC.1
MTTSRNKARLREPPSLPSKERPTSLPTIPCARSTCLFSSPSKTPRPGRSQKYLCMMSSAVDLI